MKFSRRSLRAAAISGSALALFFQSAIAAPITASAASAALPNCGATIAMGSSHALALRADGTVWAWGRNSIGQLGNNDATHTNSNTPVEVTDAAGTGALSAVVAIAAGGDHSMALRTDGTVWSWGNNGDGELGNNDGTHTNTDRPVQAVGVGGAGLLTNVVAIAAGRYHELAVLDDGTMVSWGRNDFGQLGINDNATVPNSDYPRHVVGTSGSGNLGGVTAIGAGNYYSMALLNDTTVVTFGQNDTGQLGDGTNGSGATDTPQHVLVAPAGANFTGVKEIAPNRHQALALKTDGTIWGWGSNATDELGQGPSGNSEYDNPVQVHGIGDSGNLTGVTALSMGGHHALGLQPDTSVLSWGKNSNGQLGQGTSGGTVSDPAAVSTLGSVVELGTGDNSSMALKSDGTVWTFGYGGDGELGNGTNASTQNTAVQVSQASGLTAVPGACLAVSAVNAASTSCNGGVPVTITGSGFLGATSVKFGGVEAQSFVVNSDTQISAVSPATAEGNSNVTVTTPRGTSAVAGATFDCVLPNLPQAGSGVGRPPLAWPAVLALVAVALGAGAATLARRRP